jgi:hypothetical protein
MKVICKRIGETVVTLTGMLINCIGCSLRVFHLIFKLISEAFHVAAEWLIDQGNAIVFSKYAGGLCGEPGVNTTAE